MEINRWYIHDNGTFNTMFYCVRQDGEYLFAEHNINGKGYSLLLCRLATEEEIKNSWIGKYYYNLPWKE